MKKILAVAGSLMLAATVLMTGCGGGGGDKKAADAGKDWKPTKDVKVIIAYKAGSGTDTGARLLLNNAKPYVGQTMVIVTHDAGLAQICDRTCILRDGEFR